MPSSRRIVQSPMPNEHPVFVISVSGLGYGIISGLFAMVNVLADITGPGSLGLHGDPQNFLIVSGKLHSLYMYVVYVPVVLTKSNIPPLFAEYFRHLTCSSRFPDLLMFLNRHLGFFSFLLFFLLQLTCWLCV